MILELGAISGTFFGLPYDDQHTVTGMKQTSQAEMTATKFTKISCRDPSEAPLSPWLPHGPQFRSIQFQ